MKISLKLATMAVAGSLLAAGLSGSASAASLMTTAFVANVQPNVDFLDRSSRVALDHSSSARVKAFARSEAIEQTVTANSLVAWSQANTTDGALVAITPAVDPITGLAFVPLNFATNVGTDVGTVVTGRSVATDDAPLTVTPAPRDGGGALLPAGETDLSRLETRTGHSFDALYRTTQLSALRQLATLYADYIRNGDDPALHDLAARELPKINARIAELRRI